MSYEGWAIVEIMGHRRLGGKVAEVEQFGCAMLQLDVHGLDDEKTAPVTQYYGGSSIFAITPTTEELARKVGELSRPAPVHRFELAGPATPYEPDDDGESVVPCRDCGADISDAQHDDSDGLCDNCTPL